MDDEWCWWSLTVVWQYHKIYERKSGELEGQDSSFFVIFSPIESDEYTKL